eukprot:16070383-Heterocapsa_arctica.AAC.1
MWRGHGGQASPITVPRPRVSFVVGLGRGRRFHRGIDEWSRVSFDPHLGVRGSFHSPVPGPRIRRARIRG